jgi:hypothetical protein
MLVLHDDAKREYAYGPAQGLPNTKVGTFIQETLRRGEEARLDRHQHEERLEAYFRLRELTRFYDAHRGQAIRERESYDPLEPALTVEAQAAVGSNLAERTKPAGRIEVGRLHEAHPTNQGRLI